VIPDGTKRLEAWRFVEGEEVFEQRLERARKAYEPEDRYFTMLLRQKAGKPPAEVLYDAQGAMVITTKRVNGKLMPRFPLILIALTLATWGKFATCHAPSERDVLVQRTDNRLSASASNGAPLANAAGFLTVGSICDARMGLKTYHAGRAWLRYSAAHLKSFSRG
jgi:hypothetical protein